MHVVEEFPNEIREIEHLWIPMSDGTRLSARLWMPVNAEQSPVPAILEYIPYRKRDYVRPRDQPIHRYLAGNGYASVRVDIRGSGDSEGLLTDMYLQSEMDDAVEAIAWIARQPWCDGNVGMMGTSWGGTNSLQVAARRPENLKAIVACCATDNRYGDDIHYKGGCLLNESVQWGSTLPCLLASPPDPDVIGEGWRQMWEARLDGLAYPLESWVRHNLRDSYWRHGSVCEDPGNIRCPVYLVGGWQDPYSNTVLRLFSNLEVPRKALIGPWGHQYPHAGFPGPAIGFLQELVRWWDHWLRGRDSGLMNEAAIQVWVQESETPSSHPPTRQGRWVGENQWRVADQLAEQLYLDVGGLRPTSPKANSVTVRPALSVGLASGDSGYFGLPWGMPGDQRVDDALSCTFDSGPLERPFELVGAPQLTLQVSVDQPVAMLAARLCDVRADGAVARVSYGLTNLNHRNGSADYVPLSPGEVYDVELALHNAAYRFPAGSRIRLSLSTSYWPIAWPSPALVTANVHTGRSRLSLPLRGANAEDDLVRDFAQPEAAKGPVLKPIGEPRPMLRNIVHDPIRNSVTRIINGGSAVGIEDIGLDFGRMSERRYDIVLSDPNSCAAEFKDSLRYSRDGFNVEVRSSSSLRSSPGLFHLGGQVTVVENGKTVYCREWSPEIERRGL